MKYPATERAWVARILARLTPDQRKRYETECRDAARHHSTKHLYDAERARIAERIMYDDARRKDREDA